MLKFFITLITGNTLQKLQAKHSRALNVFEKAYRKLDRIGDKLHDEKENVSEQIEALVNYRDSINVQLDQTDASCRKIKSILQ